MPLGTLRNSSQRRPGESWVRSSIQSTTVSPASVAASIGCSGGRLAGRRRCGTLEQLGQRHQEPVPGTVGGSGRLLVDGRTAVSKRDGYMYWPMPSSGSPGSRGEKRWSSELTE